MGNWAAAAKLGPLAPQLVWGTAHLQLPRVPDGFSELQPRCLCRLMVKDTSSLCTGVGRGEGDMDTHLQLVSRGSAVPHLTSVG